MSNVQDDSEHISIMRCFRRKRLHLILALRDNKGIDLLVHFALKLVHIHTMETTGSGNNFTLCPDSLDAHRWLVGGGGYDDEGQRKGFIKSIRIVYK